ncbi:ferredoxin-NADP reductase [Spinactinospora alkalitolerans]|uniref:Ferredoxin-NADP reductase n=1 Tax=Spinactinospora alkalitolerans TaxID=687207 RepID=A0A852TU14_9ACTN|nr:PDR/VanB family oxidoreductase [Spinactinospora alkalitolerans]NYE47151.1 ferredoxin-NADP reductase [Spinactinospora alkalitolerans]
MLDLEVRQLRVESENVLSVQLADPQNRILPAWEPGAHIDLTLGGHIRQYSLCGDPADRRSYRVAVLRETLSRGGSSYVHEELRPGHQVEVGGPRNHFSLLPAKEYVFIAGGIGVTPILPMIAEADRQGAPWRLVYGGRRRGSMAFLDELAAYGERVVIWPEKEYGLIDLLDVLGEAREDAAVYCCGPEALLAAVEQRCEDWPDGTLHTERFTAAARGDDPSDLRAFEVVVASSGKSFRIPPGRSVLEVLDEAGIRVPSACTDGICGSCETGVLSGQPVHRDLILDSGNTDSMMLCVSRAQSDEIVLDL